MRQKSALAVAVLLCAAPSFAFAQTPATGQAPATRSQTPSTTAPAQHVPGSTGTPGATAAPGGPAPIQAVDPAKAAAVKQLMSVTGSGQLGEEIVNVLTTQVRQGVGSAIADPVRLQKFMDAFSQKFSTRLSAAQIDEAVVPIYAEHLSLEDIQALVAFYQTPAGQHVIKALPQIVQESQSAGAQMARAAAIDTLHGMTAEYPELNQIVPGGGPAPAGPRTAPPPGTAPAPATPRPAPAPQQ